MGSNVESIKERLGIVEVVEQYVKLEKAGINWKGKCPFHNEKTASFLVSPSRNSYYCFGCGQKGDIFTITQELEGIDFRSALKLLADKAGVELVNDNRDRSEETELRNALEDATKFFVTELAKNPEAQAYLHSRGLNEETIKDWRLGFAADEWRGLYAALVAKGYTTDILIKAGLVKKSAEHQDKEPYDVFRNRVIFPMFDPSGKPIAFSGRGQSDEVQPKYLNSPDTLLFQKSEVLYGLDKAKDEIRRKNYAVLVEGQMDLVLSHQAGVKNVVASSGTAFTSLHLERLKRLSPRIILAFDPDEAGRKAAEKSASLAMQLGMDVKVARLLDGKDPADLIKEDPELWKSALRDSKHALETFVDDTLKSEKDARKAGKEIVRKILPLVALLASSIEQSYFVSLISKKTGIKESVIEEDLRVSLKPNTITKQEDVVEGSRGVERLTWRERLEKELEVNAEYQIEQPEVENLKEREVGLRQNLEVALLEEELGLLRQEVRQGSEDPELMKKIESMSRELDEKKRKVV